MILSYSDLVEETKIEELKTKIADLTKLSYPIEIRSGFPPKVLTASDKDTLKTCGIKSGGEREKFAQSFLPCFYPFQEFSCFLFDFF